MSKSPMWYGNMARLSWRVTDISFAASNTERFGPSSGATRPPWADTKPAVITAAMRDALIILVETGTAQNVKVSPVLLGSRSDKVKC
jgi:hypothetical protein